MRRGTRSDPGGPGDRGAAAVWVLGCGAVVLAVAMLVLVRSLAVLARHRAETAADLAALAAAGRIGVGGDPCLAARAVARADDAELRSCVVSLDAGGRSGTVRIEVRARARLPVVGVREAAARARAARLPGPSAGPSPSPHRAQSCRCPGLWHADAGENRRTRPLKPRANAGHVVLAELDRFGYDTGTHTAGMRMANGWSFR